MKTGLSFLVLFICLLMHQKAVPQSLYPVSFGFQGRFPSAIGNNYTSKGSMYSLWDKGYKGILDAGLFCGLNFTKRTQSGVGFDFDYLRNHGKEINMYNLSPYIYTSFRINLDKDLSIVPLVGVGYTKRLLNYFSEGIYTSIKLSNPNALYVKSEVKVEMIIRSGIVLYFTFGYHLSRLEFSMYYEDSPYYRHSHILSNGFGILFGS